MAREQMTHVIDGKSYLITQLDPRTATKIAIRLVKTLGIPLGGAIGALDNKPGQSTSMNIDMQLLGKAISSMFEKIDEKGWPIAVRVGRHCSTILQVLDVWSADHAENAVILKNVPKYAEVIAKGVGAFLRDPSKADPKRVYFE